jgi:MFS family permease
MLVAFGLWVRSGVAETPLFRRLEREQAKARAPVAEALRCHWRGLLIGGGVRLGPDVLYSLTVVFALTYLTTVLGLSRTLALTALSIGGVCHAVSIPLFGELSDRCGRRVVYGAGVLLGTFWVWMFFALLETKSPVLITVAVSAALVIHAMMYGPQAAFIAEQFPTRVRYAGSSLAYTFAGIVGGGIAPAIFVKLLSAYSSPRPVAIYATVALLITGAVVAIARERAGDELE